MRVARSAAFRVMAIGKKNNVQTRGGMSASALMVDFAVVNGEFRSSSSDS
jgi:hypothetical protein